MTALRRVWVDHYIPTILLVGWVGLVGLLTAMGCQRYAGWWAVTPDHSRTDEVCKQMERFDTAAALAGWIGQQDRAKLSEVMACAYFKGGLADWLSQPPQRPLWRKYS